MLPFFQLMYLNLTFLLAEMIFRENASQIIFPKLDKIIMISLKNPGTIKFS